MFIVALRHAERERKDGEDSALPLTQAGRLQVEKRGLDLKKLKLIPDVCCTSKNRHAIETGELLIQNLCPNRSQLVFGLDALTPAYQGPSDIPSHTWTGSKILNSVVTEVQSLNANLEKHEVVLLVLHAPRLQQLASGLIQDPQQQQALKSRDLAYSDGVVLEADSLQGFLNGEGRFKTFLV